MTKPIFRFTVCTPTYNRADLLHRVFDSLQKQTFRNFEWLVVDDGSTDDTSERVSAWKNIANFPVKYIRQKNQHKKVAVNNGIRHALGEFFLILDSDDEILAETLEIMNSAWCSIPEHQRDGFAGVTGLCVHKDGSIVGDHYPQEPFDSDSLETHFRYRIRGEKYGFKRTDILRRFSFPENVSGLVPENCVWYAIARNGLKTRYINRPLRIYHETPNSLIREHGASAKYADGLALLARDTLENIRWFPYRPAEFFLTAARYTRFHLHLRKSAPGKKWPISNPVARILVILLSPFGFAMFVRDVLKK